MNLTDDKNIRTVIMKDDIDLLCSSYGLGKNIYIYDLRPIAMLRFQVWRYGILYYLFNIEDESRDIQDTVENIVMERLLEISLSKIDTKFYLNNIVNLYDTLVNYINEVYKINITLDIKDSHITILTAYVNDFINLIDKILAKSIDIGLNVNDLDMFYNIIDLENCFSIKDLEINISKQFYILVIEKYFRYQDRRIEHATKKSLLKE